MDIKHLIEVTYLTNFKTHLWKFGNPYDTISRFLLHEKIVETFKDLSLLYVC